MDGAEQAGWQEKGGTQRAGLTSTDTFFHKHHRRQ